MWRYAVQLWLRDRKPVVPVVLYLRGGKADVEQTDRLLPEIVARRVNS